MLPRTMSVEEAANHFGVISATVRSWIRAGRLTATKIGKQYFIPESEVEKMLLVSRTTAQPTKLSHEESISLMYQLQKESAAAGITDATFAGAVADMDAREDEAREELRGLARGSCS